MSEQALHHPENYVLWDDEQVARISFIVPGQPVPQGSKRAFKHRTTGRVVVVDDKAEKLKPWRQEIIDTIHHYNLDKRMIGAVGVDLDFYFAHLKGHYGSGRNADVLKPSAPAYVTVWPDLDKLSRAVLDALVQGGLIADDSAVAALSAQKRYAPTPGVRVTVKRL